MANPTTNFGWVMPTSSSLVTNLPADFNTFGQAVDTSMSELLGGTTGQVLSKTSATNMDFTWVTPTDQTPLTTKGDLFTFSTVDARLAVGNNGESIYADSAATTGLRYSATPSASNPILNSAYQVWQRGTSIAATATNAQYTADRWYFYNGANQASVISRQATGDTTNLPNIQYCARVQRNASQTGVGAMGIVQSFESVNAIPFAGKTVTFSFYGRKGANYSSASSALSFLITTGTGTDQNIVTTGYTGAATPLTTTATLTTSWQRFSVSGTIAATATEFSTIFETIPVGTAGAADYFEVTGVQIDVGSVALPFRTYAATIQGELAACQRYYWRNTPGTNYGTYGVGVAGSTTNAYIPIALPVSMRVVPTSIDIPSSVSNLQLTNWGTTSWTPSAIAIADSTFNSVLLNVTTTSLVTGQAVVIRNNNGTTSSYFLGASAEL